MTSQVSFALANLGSVFSVKDRAYVKDRLVAMPKDSSQDWKSKVAGGIKHGFKIGLWKNTQVSLFASALFGRLVNDHNVLAFVFQCRV